MLSLLSSMEEGEDDDEDDLRQSFKFGLALCNATTSIHKAGDYFNNGGNTMVEMMLRLKMMFDDGSTSFEDPVIHHNMEVPLTLIQSTSCSGLEKDGKVNFRVSLFQRLGDFSSVMIVVQAIMVKEKTQDKESFLEEAFFFKLHGVECLTHSLFEVMRRETLVLNLIQGERSSDDHGDGELVGSFNVKDDPFEGKVVYGPTSKHGDFNHMCIAEAPGKDAGEEEGIDDQMKLRGCLPQRLGDEEDAFVHPKSSFNDTSDDEADISCKHALVQGMVIKFLSKEVEHHHDVSKELETESYEGEAIKEKNTLFMGDFETPKKDDDMKEIWCLQDAVTYRNIVLVVTEHALQCLMKPKKEKKRDNRGESKEEGNSSTGRKRNGEDGVEVKLGPAVNDPMELVAPTDNNAKTAPMHKGTYPTEKADFGTVKKIGFEKHILAFGSSSTFIQPGSSERENTLLISLWKKAITCFFQIEDKATEVFP